MRASMCDRTQREPLPYLRYIESSQVFIGQAEWTLLQVGVR